METLGQKLRKAREDRGLSRREALDRAGFKTSPPSRLSNYESDIREPSIGELSALAKGLGLTLFQLLKYGEPEQVIVLTGPKVALIEMWDSMDQEERDLWLSRGRKILESREADAGNIKPGLASQKTAKRMSHTT